MRPIAPLLFIGFSFLLAGCGGNDGAGCSAQFQYVPKAAYAGRYAGTFTPTGSGTATATFSITVSDLAVAAGTVSRGGSSASATGAAGDIKNGCTNDTTGFVLTFTSVEGQAQQLAGAKSRNGNFTGTYIGTLSGGGAGTVTGKFVVSTLSSG